MNDDDYDKLKGVYGEQAARSLERVYDANSRIMSGEAKPLDLVRDRKSKRLNSSH